MEYRGSYGGAWRSTEVRLFVGQGQFSLFRALCTSCPSVSKPNPFTNRNIPDHHNKTGTGITISVLFARQDSSPSLNPLIIIYGSLSIGLNVLLTLMIIIRLSLLRRRIARTLGTARSSQYTGIIAMLVESASIFVIAVLLYIIPLGLRSVVAVAPMILMSMVQAVSSFMIIYRVGKGTTKLDAHDDMSRIIEDAGVASRGMVSDIQFAKPPEVSMLSEADFGHEAVELGNRSRRTRGAEPSPGSFEEMSESQQEKIVLEIRPNQLRQDSAQC